MPTIQIQLTDEEYNQLLTLTHQATGIKAVKYCINGYKVESDMHDKYAKLFNDLSRSHSILQSRVSGYITALDLLKAPC